MKYWVLEDLYLWGIDIFNFKSLRWLLPYCVKFKMVIYVCVTQIIDRQQRPGHHLPCLSYIASTLNSFEGVGECKNTTESASLNLIKQNRAGRDMLPKAHSVVLGRNEKKYVFLRSNLWVQGEGTAYVASHSLSLICCQDPSQSRAPLYDVTISGLDNHSFDVIYLSRL